MEQGASEATEEAGVGGRPGAALGRFARRLWLCAAAAFLVNLAIWGGEFAGWVPHAYPELPLAIALMLVMWTARGLSIQARNRAMAAES